MKEMKNKLTVCRLVAAVAVLTLCGNRALGQAVDKIETIGTGRSDERLDSRAVAPAGEQKRLTVLFADYQRAFPAATLRDMYKYSFQDYFGPAHIIQDSAACAAYIESEIGYLDSIGWGYEVLYEPLRVCGQYVRVNILAVKRGLLSTGQLTSALMRSGVMPDSAMVEAWSARWPQIEQAVAQLPQPVKGFVQDSADIASLLRRGKYVFHHSSSFNSVYHYGYRLVRKDIFEQELKPLLP